MAENYTQSINSELRNIDLARRDWNSEIAFVLGPETLDAREQELIELEDFLRDRERGPQCLTCFSDQIVLLPEEGTITMPDGKSYTIHNVGFASFSEIREFTIDKRGKPSCGTEP